jgi:ParB family chromosome partitioning protein
MMKKKGLGRGMGALFRDETEEQSEEKNEGLSVIEVDINRIKPDENQPRKNFRQESLEELAVSIKTHGIINPLTVEKKDNIYTIISGERRWRAARIANLETVPVIIKNMTDMERLEIALIENVQREDLNPVEEALTYKRFCDEFNLGHEEISKKVGKSRAVITNAIRLLKLDSRVIEFLKMGRISTGHAKVILGVEDKDVQFSIAEKVIDEQLSVRQTEMLVKEIQNPEQKKTTETRPVQHDEVYRNIADKLKNILGTKVNLKDKNGKGKIEIEYYSADELERIIQMIESIN